MSDNILIPFMNAIDPRSGGVERVYHNLVPALIEHGYKVFATYNVKSDYDRYSVYTETFHMGDIAISSRKYKKKWAQLIQEKNIGIVICPFPGYECFDFFSRQRQLKVFFHIHNVPSKIIYPSISFLPSYLKGTFIDYWSKKIRYTIRYKKSFSRIKKYGMKVILLSDKFRMDINSFCDIGDDTLFAIPNPIVIDQNFDISHANKSKTILYVGRITTKQKRFQSLLNIWSKLQDILPEYNLEVVGGGQEKTYYENKAKEMGLKRICFHGFKEPDDFYKKSQMFCMVSNYEGFSMVLIEAMQYGCVPFAFDSFAALSDIIDDGINGFVIPPFKEEVYVESVANFAKESECVKDLVYHVCIEKAKQFSVMDIIKVWVNLFNHYNR